MKKFLIQYMIKKINNKKIITINMIKIILIYKNIINNKNLTQN